MGNYNNSKGKSVKKSSEMIDWWVGTVILAFFPMIVSMLINLCRYATLGLNRMIGDGELILSAFLVTTPSLIGFCRENLYQKGYKLFFFFCFLLLFFN